VCCVGTLFAVRTNVSRISASAVKDEYGDCKATWVTFMCGFEEVQLRWTHVWQVKRIGISDFLCVLV
jgi:hypothetical protein